jgi:hypothetical protein
MKQAVKTLGLFTILALLNLSASSQLKLPFGNGIANDVKKVINDYPNHFSNLRGEMIVENGQSIDYECNFKVEGAEKTMITKYTANGKNVSSWSALMLTTEDFTIAKKKFKALFQQLNNITVKMTNTNAFYLKGKYEEPVEEKKFFSSMFAFSNATEEVKKLKVEIVMEYELLEWKVKVLVYEKEREDDERGDVLEN